MSEDKSKYPKQENFEGNLDKKTKNSIINFIRLSFRRSPQVQECLKKSIHPTVKGPRGGKMYQCAKCKEGFSQKEVQIDHIEAVVPKGKKQVDMSLDEYAERLFCSVENLQVLDKECHKVKSQEERMNKTK